MSKTNKNDKKKSFLIVFSVFIHKCNKKSLKNLSRKKKKQRFSKQKLNYIFVEISNISPKNYTFIKSYNFLALFLAFKAKLTVFFLYAFQHNSRSCKNLQPVNIAINLCDNYFFSLRTPKIRFCSFLCVLDIALWVIGSKIHILLMQIILLCIGSRHIF